MATFNSKKRKREEKRSRCSKKKSKYRRDQHGTCCPVPEEPTPVRDQWNTFTVMADALQTFEEYGEDAYLFNKRLEKDFSPLDFLANQHEVDPTNWEEVINILIKVQRHFSLDFSTLCLSVNYLARYISQRPLKATILKPLGATCLYLATKIMGRKRPSAEDFLELFGDANYTPAYIAYVEKNLMCQLDYRLQGPTIDFFLEHFSLIRASSEKCSGIITRAANALTAARGIAALAMTQYGFHQYAPSLLAQCCLKAADNIFGYNTTNEEEPRDYPAHLMQECLEKTLLLVTANNNFLQQLMPGVFPETLQEHSASAAIHSGSTEVTEPAGQHPGTSSRRPKETGAGSPRKKGGGKSAAASRKTGKR
ncbi:cyclin-O protein B-like [Xenopus tropicalis]|uniref:Cyclin-O protein B-like n=1 Tax=Xenopus tropicalis TaxID=8364 RepID=A0A8J0QLA8_XENTR|nr:cyclin-O protein B-like [Xenopus tropicalis]|eukprot:XP_002935739.2 PREDICTED: cyclin-O protein B-like [Xenopus tropicalis]